MIEVVEVCRYGAIDSGHPDQVALTVVLVRDRPARRVDYARNSGACPLELEVSRSRSCDRIELSCPVVTNLKCVAVKVRHGCHCSGGTKDHDFGLVSGERPDAGGRVATQCRKNSRRCDVGFAQFGEKDRRAVLLGDLDLAGAWIACCAANYRSEFCIESR